MQLIELTSNKESFNSITFKSGLNIIVGSKKTNDLRNTYNGVGKSLVIQLIHFCLASNKNKEFEDKLPNWEFSLKFKIKDKVFISLRKTSDQNKIWLNGKEKKLSEFREEFSKELFNINENIKNLSFRSLISRFIRPKKGSYISFDIFEPEEQKNEYQKLLNNSYLLGLDIKYVENKKALKQEFEDIKELKGRIEKDKLLKNYFLTESDIEIDIIDLTEKIKDLEKNLSQFKVAEDYHNIQNEADSLTYIIKDYENQLNNIKNAISNIDKTLKIKPDINEESIVKLYEEAKIFFNDNIKKQLTDIVKFHNKLLTNREQRLLEENKKLILKANEISSLIKKDGIKLNELLKYLNTHGALEEFISLNNELTNLKNKIKSLEDYKNLIEIYKKRQSEINIELEKENIKTNEYLSKNEDKLSLLLNTFRGFSKEFYKDKAGGIDISNNDGKNTLRFNIKVHIQDDASDGINEVKIFCFDLLLLKLGYNHNIKMLFHDSRILGNMDSRQIATLLKVAFENTKNKEFQYIISINDDNITTLKDIYTTEEITKIILDNKIIELTDESDKNKLLGIQVDMNYED